MTFEEKNKCKKMSYFLFFTSIVGFFVIFKMSVCFKKEINYLFLFFIIICEFYLVFKTIHFFLDALFFFYLGKKNSKIEKLDQFIKKIFKKNISGKSINERIRSTFYQVKIYLLILFGLFFFF